MTITRINPENANTYLENRIDALKQAVPEAFADGKINWETLREILDEDLEEGGCPEYFGLNWPGKAEARKRAAIPSRGTLVPVYGEGVNEDNTENLFIEGDNLEVLRLLQKSYAGKIKMIYIDPPYNTGNDFIYNDDFTDPLEAYLRYTGAKGEGGELLTTSIKSSGRFHSNWLNMMYPRLVLGKMLLSETGVIVIHIDEHEYSTLLLLMNEIFGEENDLGTIIWDKKNPKGDSKGIASQNESIIVFAKNKQELLNNHDILLPKENADAILKKAEELYEKLGHFCLPDDLKQCLSTYSLDESFFSQFRKKVTLEDINTEFSQWIRNQNFSGGERAYSQIDDNGEVFQSVSMAWPNKKRAPDDYFIPLIHPKTQKPCPIPARGWRNPPSTMEKLLEEDKIVFGPDETTQPRRKYLLRENIYENVSSVLAFGGSDDALLNSLGIPFDNPKPIEVSKKLIKAFSESDSIILDFFAGSGTTGHAVLDLNYSEDSDRKFILVQLPEKVEASEFHNIAEIGKARIRRAIEKFYSHDDKTIAPSPLFQDGELRLDLGFRVFSYSPSAFKKWDSSEEENIERLPTVFQDFMNPLVLNWNKTNLMSELLLIEGFPLTSTMTYLEDFHDNELYNISAPDWCTHELYICLDAKIHNNTIRHLEMAEDDIFICLDSALTDELKVRIQDKFNVHVI